MKATMALVTGLAATLLAGCASTASVTPGSSSAPQFAAADGAVAITTRSEFQDRVVGRALRLLSDDIDATLQFAPDGSASGTANGDPMQLQWIWENAGYCRTGTVGEVVLERDCEAVELVPDVGVRLSYLSGEKADEYWLFDQ